MKLVLRRNTARPEYDTRFSVSEMITLLLLFLAAINFLNREIYCFFIAFAFLLFIKRRFPISKKVIAVFLFSFALLVFRQESHGTLSTMVSTFIYPVCFVIGYCFTEKQVRIERKAYIFLTMAVVLAMGNLMHMALNVLTDLESENRNSIDIWTGLVRAATSQAALGVGAVTVSVATLFADTKRWHKILAIVMLVIALWCNLYLAGRTLLVIALISVAVALAYKVHITPNGRFRIVAWFLLGVAAVVLIITLDLFGIQEAVLESNFYHRFFGDYSEEISETGRWEYKKQYLRYLLDYPWGGKHIRGLVGSHAHDLYLDTYDEAGIFALMMVLAMEFQSIRTMLRLLKQDGISTYAKMLVLCILTGYHLMFMVEPIVAGMEWLLGNYCILYASMTCLLRESDVRKETS